MHQGLQLFFLILFYCYSHYLYRLNCSWSLSVSDPELWDSRWPTPALLNTVHFSFQMSGRQTHSSHFKMTVTALWNMFDSVPTQILVTKNCPNLLQLPPHQTLNHPCTGRLHGPRAGNKAVLQWTGISLKKRKRKWSSILSTGQISTERGKCKHAADFSLEIKMESHLSIKWSWLTGQS